MNVKEYNDKVNTLIKASAEKDHAINGFIVSEDNNTGINVMNLNGSPSIVFCKVDENDNPTEVIHCISVKDLNSAKRLQIWINKVSAILYNNMIEEEDASVLVTGKKTPTQTTENK